MSTLKVNTITTVDGTGNIVVSRPLSGSGASLTSLPAANLTGTLPAISGANLTGVTATPADNSITLAKLAPGTDGNLITYDASGDPAHVATGTAGHVLTSGGAGVAPTFAANTHIPADNSVTGAMIAMGSDAAGDVLTYNGTDYIRLAKGTAAQVLKMNAGATAVEWATDADTIGMAIPGSSVAGDTLYHNGTIYTRLAKGTAAQTLKMNAGATAPEWVTVAAASSTSDAHDSVLAATTPTSGEGGEGKLTETYNNGSSGVGATLTNDGTQAAFAVDGMTTVVGSRILVKNQGSEMGGGNSNGIYTVTTVGSGSVNWVLTRATDADTPAKFSAGAHCFVDGGVVNEGTAWYFHTGDATAAVDFENSDIEFRIFLGGVQSPYNSITGDLLYFNGTKYTRLTAGGSANKVLTMNSSANAPTWAAAGMAIPGSSVAGDTLYHNGTIYTRLAKGTAAQVLTMNSGATAPEWAAAGGGGGPTVVSATLTNGASSYTFSSLPSGITRMQLWFYEVSLSGTDELLVQFGDSGGIETSNYTTASGRIMVYNGTSSAISNNGGFIIRLFEAAGDWSGVYNFWKMAAYWVGAHSGYQASTSSATTGGGNKAGLSTLTQIKIRPSGSNTFTVAGSFVSKIDLLYWQD